MKKIKPPTLKPEGYGFRFRVPEPQSKAELERAGFEKKIAESETIQSAHGTEIEARARVQKNQVA